MDDEIVPWGSRAHPKVGPFAPSLLPEDDALAHVAHDDAGKTAVGGQDVRAAAENHDGDAFGVGLADRLDDLPLARRLD